jgi:hypothetical protein
METNHPVLSSLIKLHADLGGQILANKKQGAKLAADMIHVEAVIKMYAPDFNTITIAARRRYKGNPWFRRGTLFRYVLDALREAGKPLTTREIVFAMIAAKGVSDVEPKAVRDLQGGVQAALRTYDGNGVVAVGEGMPRRWALVA